MELGHPSEANSESSGVVPPNSLFVPPKGEVCFINNLPPELLSRIFDAGSAEKEMYNVWNAEEYVEYPLWDDEDKDDPNADSWDGPHFTQYIHYPSPLDLFVLKAVSTHWNDVVLSTPSLWSDIAFHPTSRRPYAYQSTLLEKGKKYPIDVYIRLRGNRDDDATREADLRFLLAMLIPHIDRWRTVEIRLSEYHLIYACLAALSDPSIPAASRLKTLKLIHPGGQAEFDRFEYPEMSKHFTLCGGSAPLLTGLALWGVHVDWSQPWIASASNLRGLELHYHAKDVRPSWTQFATILRGASALERLKLHLSGPLESPSDWFIQPTPGSPADLNASIPLLRLRELALVFIPEPQAIALFRKLYLPALKKLVLEMDGGDYTNLVHELVRPATSLSPSREQAPSTLSKLDKFKIVGLACGVGCVEMLYMELKNLTSLDLWSEHISERFLDIFCTNCTADGPGDVWLPRLTTLRVVGARTDVVCDVVRKRRDAGVPLTALYMDDFAEVKMKDVKWLNENVETFKIFSYWPTKLVRPSRLEIDFGMRIGHTLD